MIFHLNHGLFSNPLSEKGPDMTLINKFQLSLLIIGAFAVASVQIAGNILILGLLNNKDDELIEEEEAE